MAEYCPFPPVLSIVHICRFRRGVGYKVGTRARLGGSTLQTSVACPATLVASLALISVKMSGCVAAAVAFAGLKKELDANRSLDLMRTLEKSSLLGVQRLVTSTEFTIY